MAKLQLREILVWANPLVEQTQRNQSQLKRLCEIICKLIRSTCLRTKLVILVTLANWLFPAIQPMAGIKHFQRRKLRKMKRLQRKRAVPERVKSFDRQEINLVSTCNSLDDDFVKLVGDAEKRPHEMSVLVIKANALRRRQNELRMEVNELQKEIAEKRLKLR